MFCARCGTENVDKAEFCDSCGVRLNGVVAPAPAQPPPPSPSGYQAPGHGVPTQPPGAAFPPAPFASPPSPRRGMGPILGGAVVVALLAAAGYWFFVRDSGSKETPAASGQVTASTASAGSTAVVLATPSSTQTAAATAVPTRALASATVPQSKSPSQVVSDFYTWYLAYSQTGNPLSGNAYRTRPELSPSFVSMIDQKLGTIMYDPFLCAQDLPTKITPGVEVVTGDTASVPVTSTFAFSEPHSTVLLTRTAGGSWLISDIRCAG